MDGSMVDKLFLIPPDSPLRTFQYDDELPNLPLPQLHQTLMKYVDSVKPFLTKDELEKTLHLVTEFENGVGPKLQDILMEKAKNERNWLERWWEDLAYLSNREPLLPFSQMMGVSTSDKLIWGIGEFTSQAKNAALFCYYTTELWLVVHQERLRPDVSRDGKKHFSMYGFRRFFNSARLPGDPYDSLVSHFKTANEGSCPSHVVVLCNGHIFAINTLHTSGDLLTPPEWECQLRAIKEKCYEKGLGVPLLTCTDRSTWNKNRKYLLNLSEENRRIINIIETSLYALCLDTDVATSPTDIVRNVLCGQLTNRWADKSMSVIFFRNGVDGVLSEHSGFDGMVSVLSLFYVSMKVQETNFRWQGSCQVRELEDVEELEFKVDNYIIEELQKAKHLVEINSSSFSFLRDRYTGYGKEVIKTFKIHPDSFIQMVLQLAYYRMHGRPAPTYETGTTREFYHGRTETVRSCTVEVVEWIKAMSNPDISNLKKKDLLKRAVQKHDQLMNEAKANAGCDRHLMGLYCAAMEEGLEVPEIFLDPAFVKSGGNGNFILSTSLIGYTPIGGGVVPMHKDGYGCFYSICPDNIGFTLIVYKESQETSAYKFYYKYLQQAFEDTKNMLQDVPSSNL